MITYPSIEILLDVNQIVTFSRDKIISASVVDEINVVGTELPISTLEFTAKDENSEFSMFDGEIYSKLKEKLPITVYEFLDNTSHLVGEFYLDTWKNINDNQMEFTAMNIIGVLADIDFDGIFWFEPVTLTEAMRQIFQPIGINYEIDGEIADSLISGWIPPSTYRDALQQICFASGAIPLTAQRSNLYLTPYHLPDLNRDYVAKRKNAKQNSIEILPLVGQIEVVSHNYTESGEIATIFEKELEAGNHKIVFPEPYYDVEVSGAGYVEKVLATENGDYLTTENEDYIEAGGEFTFGSNSVFIYLDAPATVTITGYKYLDSKRSFLHTNPSATSSNKKSFLISDATLVNIDRGQDVLDRIKDFYDLRYLQEIDLLPTTAKVNDIIVSDAINQNKIIAIAQKSVMGLASGYLPRMTLVGKVPAYVPPMDNPYRRERVGIALCGAGMTRNNKWRQYA